MEIRTISISTEKIDTFYDATQVDRISYPEGNSLAEIYLQGDLETRLDVLFNHPDVKCFLFSYDGVIDKAYLRTKVVDFRSSSNKKIFDAVSSIVQNYTSFFVDDKILLGDVHYLSNCTKFNKSVTQINVTKDLKDFTCTISPEIKEEAKSRKITIVSFPLILPITQGMTT